MKRPPRVPTLIILAIAIAIVVWAYSERDVHATVSFDQDELVIKPGSS